MPRIVDHDQRRADIAEAALRVILKEGLDGVTVRGIASEVGCSTGALRHYFANQQELQAYVVHFATTTLRERVLPRVQRPRTSSTAVDAVISIVEELLPIDAERRDEYAWWLAVAEWERRQEPADGSRTWQDQRALYRQCIALLCGRESAADLEGALRSHADPIVEEWAAVLHTFVDGLASQLVTTPGEVTPEASRRLLGSLLQAVPCGPGIE